ncbi:MAG: hypothetical protein LBL99_01690 [Holosporaceae bacterium]|jgi:hypothetical protein|nr:hypothetical protein [Holosporaceae bacterium]
MADEIDSIIEEINEEIKNDQFLQFLKKHKNTIGATIAVAVIGILAYSSWYSRKKEQMQEITNVLLEELQAPSGENLVLAKLAEDAPAELKPMLLIMAAGKNLRDFKDVLKNAETLLALTKKSGVDIVWKDLATIIYVSYRLKKADELIKLLEPLTADDRPFRFTALEFIAMSYESLGDHKKAEENLKKIVDNAEAPRTLKKRIAMLLNRIKNNSGE